MLRTETPVALNRLDYTPPTHLIPEVNLTISLDDTSTRVTSRLRVVQNGTSDTLFLNGEKQKLISVTLNGQPASYTADEHGLNLNTNGLKEFDLEIVSICNPAENTANKGLYMSDGFFCTQCEAEGFRRITYFIDRPDVLSRYTVRLEGDQRKHPVLLSNGNIPHESGDLPGGRHFATYRDDTPKPCYLFALTAGELHFLEDHFTTCSGADVRLRIYVDTENKLGRCAWAMDSLKRAMRWDEEKWGREYQFDRFDIVAVSKFNMGAMENTTLNIFNDALILGDDQTATDAQLEAIEGVVGHEYFHNWTGNRITCRDWFQLTLKEGLTVFRDQEFSADMNSRNIQRIDDVTQLRARQFPEDAGPMAHPIRPDSVVEINNFYTPTVYEKGAEVIRMEKRLAEAKKQGGFRAGTDIYFNRHDGQAVTCDEWAKSIVDGSGVDFTQFMRWYEQAGTPEVTADMTYDAAKKTVTLTLSQHTAPTADGSAKKPFHIPVAVGLLGPKGEDLVGTRILELKEPTQTFTFEGIAAKPVPSILRDFSAPVKLKTNQTDDDLRFLMVHDTDGFNKWDAGQTYFKRVLNAMIDAGQHVPPAAFVDTIGHIVAEALAGKSDPALLARALALPDIAMIGLDRKIIDPDAIYAARQGAIKAIDNAHRENMHKLYGLLNTPVEKDAKGRRALKNLILRYLDDSALAKRQYDHAQNLTDRMGALYVLAHHETPEAVAAFSHCAKNHADNHLIIDNWFRAKASGIRPNLLKDIAALAADKNFDWKTPNRVRSLYGMFGLNVVMFHAKDGSGYTFSKNAIIKMDAINPEVAVQIMRPFREWRHYTPDRQEKMKAALVEIARQPNLSRDVYEIVSKTLGDALPA